MPSLPEGAVLDVVRSPAPVLATPGADVDPTDPAVVQLAADLLATQAVSPGCVGLAAQQVGVAWRVFSVDVTGHPKTRVVPRPVRPVQRDRRVGQPQGEGPGRLHVGARFHR